MSCCSSYKDLQYLMDKYRTMYNTERTQKKDLFEIIDLLVENPAIDNLPPEKLNLLQENLAPAERLLQCAHCIETPFNVSAMMFHDHLKACKWCSKKN